MAIAVGDAKSGLTGGFWDDDGIGDYVSGTTGGFWKVSDAGVPLILRDLASARGAIRSTSSTQRLGTERHGTLETS